MESSALTARLYELRNQERTLLVEFLEHLSLFDSRRGYVACGYSSLFAFLVEYLGYSRSAAFRRTTAARLLARFPAISAYLADGRLGLTTLVDLREVLDEQRVGEILERAAGKTEDEVKQLVAALRPRPAPPDLLRRLPRLALDAAPSPDGSAGAAPDAPAEPRPASPARPASRLEPISEDLRVLRVTVGTEFYADLQAVRSALSHTIPDGSLEKVLHECLRRTLRELRRRQSAAVDRPSPRQAPAAAVAPTRSIPASVRREVWRRDQGRCTFVGSDGHACGSDFQLELHHIHPFAKGGPSTAANLTLTCRVHNAHLAEQDFGADHLASAISGRHGDRRVRQLTLV